MPYPFQIIQTPHRHRANANRTIDRQTHGGAHRFLAGWSNGHWDGDTLVVDVTAWFDRAGNHHSNELHVVERYTPISPYKPRSRIRRCSRRTISFPLYRRIENNVRLLEFKCGTSRRSSSMAACSKNDPVVEV